MKGNTIHSMPPSRMQLSESLIDTLASLQSARSGLSDAWALRMSAFHKAHFAAVMGNSLTRNCREQGWIVEEALRADVNLVSAVQHYTGDAGADVIYSVIADHIRWILEQIEKEITADISAVIPSFDPATDSPQQSEHTDAQREYARAQAEEDGVFRSAVMLADRVKVYSDPSMDSTTDKRSRAVDLHGEQYAHILSQAGHLHRCDSIKSEVDADIRTKEGIFPGTAREFLSSPEYSSCQKELKTVAQIRTDLELALQTYFDHHSQGASRSESVKVERKALKLVPELTSRRVGFKMIQEMETFLQGRGNEMWAIIPDLLRIGHDIDPVSFLHWQPPLDDAVPLELRSYRQEQNTVLATKLLGLLNSAGLRQTVLAHRSYGANKVPFKASETDGCSIYWVMLQLYHPIDRSERRKIEKDIEKAHETFSSGNPHSALKKLRTKVQEGLDIAVKLRWDSAGIPLIDTLCSRDSMFTVELNEWRDKPLNTDDSLPDLDEMLSKVEEVIETLDSAAKQWSSKSAMSATPSKTEKKLEKLEKQVKMLQSQPRSSKTPDPNKSKKDAKAFQNELKKDKGPGFCQAVGCGTKIPKFDKKGGSTSGWKLCATCMMKFLETKKPVKLVDGRYFGDKWDKAKNEKQARVAQTLLGQMRTAGVKGIPASNREQRKSMTSAERRQAKKAKLMELETSEDSEPDHNSDSDGERDVAWSKAMERRQAKKASKRKRGISFE